MTPFIFMAFIAVLVLTKAVMVVRGNQRYVITRLGRLLRVAGPGLIIVVPFIDVVAARYDLDMQELPFAHEGRELVIRYRVLDPQKAFVGIADVNQTLTQSTRTAIESSGTGATDVFARKALVEKVNSIVASFGLHVSEIDLAQK